MPSSDSIVMTKMLKVNKVDLAVEKSLSFRLRRTKRINQLQSLNYRLPLKKPKKENLMRRKRSWISSRKPMKRRQRLLLNNEEKKDLDIFNIT